MDNKIISKLASYFQAEQDVIAVYLFGSFAEGRQRNYSDVDIGVLFDRVNAEVQYDLFNKYLGQLPPLIRKDIHLVILNTAGEELMRQIYLKGKCIAVNSAEKLAHFNMTMYSKIADFEFYRGPIQKGFTKKLMEEKI